MIKVIIDIEKLKEEVNGYKCKHPIYAEQKKANEMIDLFINIIDSYADEGEEIKTGEWIISQTMDCHSDIINIYTCPFCGKKEYSAYPYCHCGAKLGKGGAE